MGASREARVRWVRAACSTAGGTLAVSASAGAVSARTTPNPVSTLINTGRSSTPSVAGPQRYHATRTPASSRTDHHGPGTFTGRDLLHDRHRRRIDDRDFPDRAIGAVEPRPAAAERDTPGAPPAGGLAEELRIGERDGGERAGAPGAHVEPPPRRIERDTHGTRLRVQFEKAYRRCPGGQRDAID